MLSFSLSPEAKVAALDGFTFGSASEWHLGRKLMPSSRKCYFWLRKASYWLILALTLSPGVLSAAVFTTGTLNDSLDDDRSLRYLVRNSQWGDTIVLGVPGTIVLNALFGGEIHVDHDLTITAVGLPRDYLISGSFNPPSRIFSVSPGTGPIPSLNLFNLTLTGGSPGGGVGNYLYAPYSGGAIYASDANLNLNVCIVSSNSATYGGGICFVGGGICNITECTILTNSAYYAGGVQAGSCIPGSSFSRSTFSGNDGATSGGAILGALMDITDCTIVGNTAGATGGGIDGSPTFLQNTIIAGNFLRFPDNLFEQCQVDLGEVDQSGGFNFIGVDPYPCVPRPSPWQPSDQVGSFASPNDPKLGPLQDNGGPTLTYRPLTSPLSPVIDKGNSTATVDQRGFPRPYNFGVPNPPGNASDIGAVERGCMDAFTCFVAAGGPPVSGSISVKYLGPLIINVRYPPVPPDCAPCQFSYQWQLEGTNLPGAIASRLWVTNAQFSDAGNYSVVLSNSFGVVTSAVATVTVGYGLSVNTTSNNSARILFSPYQGVYGSNALVTLTAVPQYGWAFDGWSGGVNGASNQMTVLMTSNMSVTANLHYTNPPPGLQTLACSPGTALGFNGTSGSLRVPGFLTNLPTSEVTVEFWQKAFTIKTQSTFSASSFVNGSVFGAQVPYSDGNVYWDFGNPNTGGRLVWTPPAPITNAWWHFALVASQSGNFMQLYTNGVLAVSQTGMTPFVPGNLDLDIGGAAGLTFAGLIDEFRIWNYARSQSDIQNNISRSIAAPQPGLIAYWRMDEGGGLSAADASGVGHGGTLVGGTAWIPSTMPFVPCLTTGNGIALNDTNGVLSGIINPNGSVATNWFEYGGSTNYAWITPPLTNGSSASVSNVATRLPPGTLCHFRLVAMNSAGISFGQDSTFITPARLRIAPTNSNVLIAWPAPSSLVFSLQRNTTLGSTNWVNVTNVVNVVSNENQVIIAPSEANTFYRLKYP
jgi:hypothetical protein